MEFLFKNLIVWQKAMELAKLVYGLVRQLSAEERYALADQLRRAVASIPSNIAQKSNHHCPPPPFLSTSSSPSTSFLHLSNLLDGINRKVYNIDLSDGHRASQI